MGFTSTNDLPEELLLIILLLQPMKTLVLLRTVCKLWNRIISSEYFFQLFLYRQRTSTNTNNYFLLQHPCRSICLVDGETLMYRDFFVKSYKCYGICDRLFCLSTKDCSELNSEILLWNPVFSRKLPPLEIKYSKHTLLLFGYHGDDYKVLKFVLLKRTCYVCIYSLRTNNWNVLEYDDFIPRGFTRRRIKARLVNGTAYIFEDFMEDGRRIISFDLSCETFREIKYPEDGWYGSYFIMEEYRESLALIGLVHRVFRSVFVMWVLRVSDDNSFSWDEMSVIEVECWDFQPMGFINKDELVMWNATAGFLYNVENECRRKFTTGETGVAMVQSSSNFKYSISVEVVAELGDFNELRIYKIELMALTYTGNKYDELADSDSDNDLFNDLFG